MKSFALAGRARWSVELALTAGTADPRVRRLQDIDACAAGLCGAEIDAARHGRSFDVHISRAMALAIAVRDGQDGAAERECAMRAGIGGNICDEIVELARAKAVGKPVTVPA